MISCSTSRSRGFSRPKTMSSSSSKAAANLSRSLFAFMNQHCFQHSRERRFLSSIIDLIIDIIIDNLAHSNPLNPSRPRCRGNEKEVHL